MLRKNARCHCVRGTCQLAHVPCIMPTTNHDGVCAYSIQALYTPMRRECAVDIPNEHGNRGNGHSGIFYERSEIGITQRH